MILNDQISFACTQNLWREWIENYIFVQEKRQAVVFTYTTNHRDHLWQDSNPESIDTLGSHMSRDSVKVWSFSYSFRSSVSIISQKGVQRQCWTSQILILVDTSRWEKLCVPELLFGSIDHLDTRTILHRYEGSCIVHKTSMTPEWL